MENFLSQNGIKPNGYRTFDTGTIPVLMDEKPLSKHSRVITLLFLILPFISFGHAIPTIDDDAVVLSFMDEVDEEVKQRLESLDHKMMEHRYDDAVRKVIKRYLRYPKYAGILMGRTSVFFPLFEEKLATAGLPDALKYLPIVESSLWPQATSPVGAVGLWQFMPGTATEYGLVIDEFVDERVDPNRATEAAIKYLEDAYGDFEDWSLSLAAYNAGKGGVRRAQRRSGGKTTFWGIKKHLPRETRSYVPKFIAAMYLAEFFAHHEIAAVLPSLDRQITTSILIEQPLSFYQIAQITRLPIDEIAWLNPAYKMGYLPGYKNGHYLRLPSRVMPAMNTYLSNFGHLPEETMLPWTSVFELPEEASDDEQNYQRYVYPVFAGDSLSGIAKHIDVPTIQLAVWNTIAPSDSLILKEVGFYRPRIMVQLPMRSGHHIADVIKKDIYTPVISISSKRHLPAAVRNCFWYCTNRRERPSEITEKFPDLTFEGFANHTKVEGDRPMPAGTTLKLFRIE